MNVNNRGGRGGGGDRNSGNGGRGRGNGKPKIKICKHCGQEGHSQFECFNDVAADHAPIAPPKTAIPAHKVPYIDTHCHLGLVCDRARSPDYAAFLSRCDYPPTCVGEVCTLCDVADVVSSFSQREDLLQNHSNRVAFAVGLHPHHSSDFHESKRFKERFAELLLTMPNVVAIGEIGLDVTSEKKKGTDLERQVPVFHEIVEMGVQLAPHLPFQLHIRASAKHSEGADSMTDLLEFIPFQNLRKAPAVHFHSWGDPSVETAKKVLKMCPNAVFGLTGLICGPSKKDFSTPHKSQVVVPTTRRMEDFIKWVDLNKIVLESDSPFLVPLPVREGPGAVDANAEKKPALFNHPGNAVFIAAAVAHCKRIEIDTVLKFALLNSIRVYPKLKDQVIKNMSEEARALVGLVRPELPLSSSSSSASSATCAASSSSSSPTATTSAIQAGESEDQKQEGEHEGKKLTEKEQEQKKEEEKKKIECEEKE